MPLRPARNIVCRPQSVRGAMCERNDVSLQVAQERRPIDDGGRQVLPGADVTAMESAGITRMLTPEATAPITGAPAEPGRHGPWPATIWGLSKPLLST